MNNALKTFYLQALEHREIHDCGAVPFQSGDLLISLVRKYKAKKILEVGTGVGFSTACLAFTENVQVQTVDKDPIHIMFAEENIEKLGLTDRVTFYQSKIEDVFPRLPSGEYDLIFCDGHVPQRKFAAQFERLLKKGGVALTANLFLSVPSGGKYLKSLQSGKWQTTIFEDNAISIKQ